MQRKRMSQVNEPKITITVKDERVLFSTNTDLAETNLILDQVKTMILTGQIQLVEEEAPIASAE
jgi:hypothetical protein